MKPDLDRQALIDQTLAQMRKLLEEQLPDDTATLDEIEDVIEIVGNQIQKDLQQRLVQQRTRRGRENRQECACGGIARFKKQQTRTLYTRHGVLRWKRPRYRCRACQQEWAPLDATLGLDRGPCTRTVRVWSAHLAGQVPLATAQTLLQTLTGVCLSVNTIEKITVSVGTTLRQAQRADHPAGAFPAPPVSSVPDGGPRRVYVGVDGIFAPLRDAWKKDGTAGPLQCRFAEGKVGVIYETDQDRDGKDTRVRQHAYVGTFDPIEEFGPLLSRLAAQQGVAQAAEVVFLGDGASWIWQLAALRFPSALQILDFYHACEHLANVADARFGAQTPESRDWQEARQAELKANQLDLVLQAIRAWKPTNAAKRDLRRKEYEYFVRNAERMRYQTYLQKGYHIGSGVVEATGKRLVHQRLDQAGMHWREPNAEAVLVLRAALCSSAPPDLAPYCAMAA